MRRTVIMSIVLFFCISITSGIAQNSDEFHLDETYTVDPGGTIHLSSDDAEVRIIGSDRDDVRVVVRYELEVKGITFGDSNEFEMIVEEQNGNLRIREKERDFGNTAMIGYSREEYTIEIETPRDVNLQLEGDDEEYEIMGIGGSIDLTADDSDARLTVITGDDFSFRLDDGSVEMTGGSGRLRVQTDDGKFQIWEGNFSEIDADSDDSDIEITTSLSDGGDYRFDLDDGDLRLNITGGGGEFDIRHDGTDVSIGRQFEVIEEDDDFILYRLGGGNARVIIRADDGDIGLRVY